jgi:hypothetical protein
MRAGCALQMGIDPSSEPKPPARTVLDWVGTLLFGLLGAPLIILCVTTLYEGFFRTRAPERPFVVIGSLMCVGLPGGLFLWRAWRIYTGRRFKWRTSMRVRRRLCIRCGYDLRGGVETCPECGMPVPEPIDRIAARLEGMVGRREEAGNSDGSDYRPDAG